MSEIYQSLLTGSRKEPSLQYRIKVAVDHAMLSQLLPLWKVPISSSMEETCKSTQNNKLWIVQIHMVTKDVMED